MQTLLDHIIIIVADLAQATDDYTLLLGRRPSWTGTHPALGTHNVLFRLDNTYLELLAIGDGGDTRTGPGAAFVQTHID